MEANECMNRFETIANYDFVVQANEVIPSEDDNFDYIDWIAVSKFNTLSIHELEEFRTRIIWEEVSKRDYLNYEYIRTFKDELYWHVLDKNPKLTDELRKEFSYKF